MYAQSGHNNHTQRESAGSGQKILESWRRVGPPPDLSAVPALDTKIILSYSLASFQSRDMAKGTSQLPHLTGTAPKSQGRTMISLSW